ncbi:MAG TPA: cupredoxin domain-containing protein [Acidimicrobiia bacterium]|nr:cupredoxin domain-containing protein [Acidimicrobiia bacterium]
MNGRVRCTLLVSSLLLAVTSLAAPAHAGGGCHSAGADAAQTAVGTDVDMTGNCFAPAALAVEPGATVRFHNHDRVSHVVIGTGWAAGDEIAPGGTAESRFVRPGTYPYSCYLHPGMNGVILVGAAAGAATPNGAEPQAAASGRPVGRSNLPPLALGTVAGGAAGVAVASRRLRTRRGR